MSYPTEVLADSPTVYYRMGETSGTTAADSSGNSHTGNWVPGGRGVNFAAVAGLLVGDPDGATQYTLSGGATDLLSMPAGAYLNFGTADFTAEVWYKGTQTGTSVLVGTGSGTSWWMGLVSGKLSWGGSITASGAAAVNDGATHHLVAARRSGTIFLYIDGVQVTSGSYAGAIGDSTHAAAFGGFGGSGGSSFPTLGTFDEGALYASGLSTLRIAAHYAAGAPAGGALTSGVASTTSVGNTIATVACTAATGGTSPYTYQWQRSLTSGSGFSNVSGATSLTLNDTGLTNGTTYYYRCVATDSAGSPATATSNETTAVPAAPVVIAVNNANMFFSPYNWRLSGSTYAQTNNPGAYLKTKFTGTSAILLLDTTPNSGESGGNYPNVAWSVDGGAFTRAQLTAGQTTLSLASALSAGTHTLELIVVSAWYTDDRWTTPAAVVRITGIQLDSGASSAAPTLQTGRAIVYGDSNGEGYEALTFGVNVSTQDASEAFPLLIGRALGCEVGAICFAAQGYISTGGGNVPTLATSWDHYDASNSRLSGGLFSPAPDYLLSMHGQNDGSSPQTTVTSLIAAWRTAAGAGCKIAICSPTNLNQAAGISAGVTAVGDALAKWVTTGEDLLGSWTSGASKQYSNANHQSGSRGHPRYASALAAGIKAAFATGGGGAVKVGC